MKRMYLWLLPMLILVLSLSIFSCGDDDDDDDDDEQAEGDDDDAAGGDCSAMPDMVVNNFSFYENDSFYGTQFSFTEIKICNNGGAAADAGSVFGFYLVTGADFTGDYYIVQKSEPLVGFASGDCVTFTQNATAGDVQEGYYYVYIVADSEDVVSECNENNNWTRSEDAIYVKPGESK